ncbi:hypothetical protein [Paenibacillus sp. FSL R7-0026]|uniref:hypothetical protein n=1 Tax=Paenibacillus sp. FSL R7-0026 TaxID=2921668 RepID=UPI0030F60666
MLELGVTIQENSKGEWEIHTPPSVFPPHGIVSRPYPTREEALQAAKERIYE